MVSVSQNLCAIIPDNVSDETASFTVLASVGLEGIRLAAPALGESFVVTGLGLIGLLTVQLLRAHGCRVLGIDLMKRNYSGLFVNHREAIGWKGLPLIADVIESRTLRPCFLAVDK